MNEIVLFETKDREDKTLGNWRHQRLNETSVEIIDRSNNVIMTMMVMNFLKVK